MNDRYLFKAKRKNWEELPKEGWWVQGNVIYDGVTGQYFIHAYGNSVNESDKVNEEGCLSFVAFEIDQSTLCQCTGLKDKNDTLIWENDIVKIGEFEYLIWWNREGQEMTAVPIDEICFNGTDYYSGCNPKFTYHDFICMMQDPYGDFINKIEVVGNKFDNPELLEVE